MASSDYHFITRWRVRSSVQEVNDLLGDALALPRWWPAVYLTVEQQDPGDERGVGKIVTLLTKGWLPYTLRWSFRVSEIRDDGFALIALGDFVGSGNWIFKADGELVDITYDWRIRVEKPLLRLLSPLVKPILERNHLWAMEMGRRSLELELRRRHDPEAVVPPPPPATPSSTWRWLLALSR